MTLQSDTFHNDLVISTHTLTWSVTRKLKKKENGIADFNSHAHVERDLVKMYKCKTIKYFNSHAHVERDQNRQENLSANEISTHTLTWSVT